MGVGAAALVNEPRPRVASEFALRPMVASDLPAVARIEETRAPRPWTLEAFRTELGVPLSRALVLHAEATPSRVSGYLARRLVAAGIQLLSVAIATLERRRGLGGIMLDEILAEAGAEEVELVTLEVETSNNAATGLYASRGFREVRCRRSYYGAGHDAAVMEWRPGWRDVS